MKIAEELRDLLVPYCTNVEIAGSLRRKKATVGDIEILYIPRIENRPNPKDFFSYVDVNLADEMIERLITEGILKKRPNKVGQFAWGEKNKLAVHCESGIPVDLFATEPSKWWTALIIRTGSLETNLKLTKGAIAKGCSLKAYGAGLEQPNGDVIVATSERHVFELCNVPYLSPEKR